VGRATAPSRHSPSLPMATASTQVAKGSTQVGKGTTPGRQRTTVEMDREGASSRKGSGSSGVGIEVPTGRDLGLYANSVNTPSRADARGHAAWCYRLLSVLDMNDERAARPSLVPTPRSIATRHPHCWELHVTPRRPPKPPSTPPTALEDGAYKALVAARLEALRAGGQEYAVTNAPVKTSAPILAHLGFETLFSTAAYTLPA
jgi:hypothetical protein